MNRAASGLSLRLRLTLTLVALFAAGGAVTAAIGYRDAHAQIDRILDAHLVQAASLLVAQASHELREVSEEDLKDLAPYHQQIAFQIWGPDGDLILRTRQAPRLGFAQLGAGLHEVRSDGRLWRVYVAWDEARETMAQVAEDHAERVVLARRIAFATVLPMLIALPLLGLGAAWLVARGLKPLADVSTELERRGPRALEPLPPQGLPAEVQPLVNRLNDLLERVRRSLEQERSFASNAAHELRNPLAALRAQAEVARDSRDAQGARTALDAVILACDRLTRLVEQLLALARVEELGTPSTPIRLDSLARDVAAVLAPRAIAGGGDLALESPGPVQCAGNASLLEAVLRNLIDNALRHGGAGASVRVSVEQDDGGCTLTVEDDGHGVAADRIGQLGNRFERADATPDSGSGLGLAIVERIARWHGGTLAFAPGANGRGLKVSLRLPPPPQAEPQPQRL